MNKEKVYIEGYEVDTRVSPLGYLEKKIQLMNGEFVIVDENFIHKSIEPQPVKVPQCVADWYLLHYHDFNNSIVNLCIRREDSIDNNDFLKWISNTKDFIQILVNIHQFGYEVEEEKRYLVKIKATKHYFVKDGNGKIFFSLAFKGCFTKKELEDANFGWVFSCEGIEIEEVE